MEWKEHTKNACRRRPRPSSPCTKIAAVRRRSISPRSALAKIWWFPFSCLYRDQNFSHCASLLGGFGFWRPVVTCHKLWFSKKRNQSCTRKIGIFSFLFFFQIVEWNWQWQVYFVHQHPVTISFTMALSTLGQIQQPTRVLGSSFAHITHNVFGRTNSRGTGRLSQHVQDVCLPKQEQKWMGWCWSSWLVSLALNACMYTCIIYIYISICIMYNICIIYTSMYSMYILAKYEV